MSEPSGFDRPDAWHPLDQPSPSLPPAAPPSSGTRERRRWFSRRRKHGGLGRSAGPDFRWPAAPAVPDPRTRRPAGSPVASRTANRGNARSQTGETVRSLRLRLFRAVLVLLAVIGVLALVAQMVGGRSGRTRTVPTTSRTAPAATLPARWTATAGTLRPELAKAEFLSSADGAFDDNSVVDGGKAWLVLTGDGDDGQVWVHGVDPGDGRELWKRSLDSGVCASTLVDGAALCASAVRKDPATGLGTRWHLALLEPATGRQLRGTEWDGWLTLVHVEKNRVLLVEQRQPAPHAVLTGLDSTLAPRWQLDLRAGTEHPGLFSDNRIYDRKLPLPPGPALDRPRLRQVGKGLTALWAGQTTVFVDLVAGRLAGMPRCSRLVDDGERLWCNQGPSATALSYAVRPLYSTELNTRLAFPNRDPRAGDVTDPVFLRQDGQAVRVDLGTGRTLGPLVNTRNGSAFGMSTPPQTALVDGITLVWDSSNLFAVRARTGKLLWQVAEPGTVGDALEWKGRILLADRNLRLLERAGGRTIAQYRQPIGLRTQAVGPVLVAVGPGEIARLVDP